MQRLFLFGRLLVFGDGCGEEKVVGAGEEGLEDVLVGEVAFFVGVLIIKATDGQGSEVVLVGSTSQQAYMRKFCNV
jgi:hypothetical protein